MRVAQRALILRLRHQGVMANLPPHSHPYLGNASQHGIPAAPPTLEPPPPLREVMYLLVRSGLHPGSPTQCRMRAALLVPGRPRPRPRLRLLQATTDLPGLMRMQRKRQSPGCRTDARGAVNTPSLRVVPHLHSATIGLLEDRGPL